MNTEIMGLKINYDVQGEGCHVLVLHGWGANIAAVGPICDLLRRHFRVFVLDLPGFGASQEPPDSWDVYDFARFVSEFAQKTGVERPVVIGHSFGGRLAIILSAQKLIRINKLVLVDSAGVLPKRGVDYYLKVYTYKAAKRLLNILPHRLAQRVMARAGSQDYRSASAAMRKIMVRVVNEDLTYLLKDVNVPALLIWGENDQATPVSDGKLMEKLIPDAGLVVLKDAGHFSYLDRFGDFSAIIMKFLENDMRGGEAHEQFNK